MHSNHDKIEELVEQAQTPLERGILFMVARLNESLAENTRATKQIADTMERSERRFEQHLTRFDAHEETEMQLIGDITRRQDRESSTFRGIAIGAGAIISIVMAASGFLLTRYIDANESNVVVLQDVMRRVSILEKLMEHEHPRVPK